MSPDLLLLAAGGSTRFGRPKLLAQVSGESLLRRAIGSALASRARSVSVVLGAHRDLLRRELDGLNVRVVVNERWNEGLSSSIRAGMNALPPDTHAVLLHLSDMPGVDASHLNALIDASGRPGNQIVASRYGESLGVPAVFSSSHFGELCSLRGDAGARSIIERHRPNVVTVDLNDAGDVDTPEDLHGAS